MIVGRRVCCRLSSSYYITILRLKSQAKEGYYSLVLQGFLGAEAKLRPLQAPLPAFAKKWLL